MRKYSVRWWVDDPQAKYTQEVKAYEEERNKPRVWDGRDSGGYLIKEVCYFCGSDQHLMWNCEMDVAEQFRMQQAEMLYRYLGGSFSGQDKSL